MGSELRLIANCTGRQPEITPNFGDKVRATLSAKEYKPLQIEKATATSYQTIGSETDQGFYLVDFVVSLIALEEIKSRV